MSIEAMKQAYLAGFMASGEGYNGEYPFQDKGRNPENDPAWCRDRDNALRTAIEQAEKQEPVALDVFELRLYGAPLEKQHRVLWVDRYTHPDGSTPDLDGLLEAATKDGGIDGGAKTLYVRPLYTTPPAAPGYIKGDTRSGLVDNDFEENT